MKFLISDHHVGCQLWQYHLLRELGIDAKVISFSKHLHFFKGEISTSPEEKRFIDIVERAWGNGWGGKWSPEIIENLQADEAVMRAIAEYSHLLVSFPPSMTEVHLSIADDTKATVIANCGHRFNIGIKTRSDNQRLKKKLVDIHQNSSNILGAMSEYDFQYLKHYLNIEVEKLFISCFHIPLRLPEPALSTILLGPVNLKQFGPFSSADDINQQYQSWSVGSRARTRDWNFSCIRDLYEDYNLEDLARHPAVIIFPYSVFSVSMVELYELNIPFFVPSPDLLIQHNMMIDRALHPVYCTKEEYKTFLEPKETGFHPFSPNSYEEPAQKYWLQFCYFYQQENSIVWDSPEDLFSKLNALDLEVISKQMYDENKRARQKAMKTWKQLLTQ